MAENPCPILIVSAAGDEHRDKVFEALGAGALDVVRTPVLGAKESNNQLLPRLTAWTTGSAPSIFPRNCPRFRPSPGPPRRPGAAWWPSALRRADRWPSSRSRRPAGRFPGGGDRHSASRLPVPVRLAEWLDQHSRLPVRLAREGERPVAGTILIAGSADHLILTEAGTLDYTSEPSEIAYRPSVDVFFPKRGEKTGAERRSGFY